MLESNSMEEKIKDLKAGYLKKISEANSLKTLDEIYLSLFGKNGEITLLPKGFASEPKENLKLIGPLFNQTKQELEKAVEEKRNQVREEGYKNLIDEKMDLPKEVKVKQRKGYMHPLTKFEKEIADLFGKIGFQEFDAPHIDSDFNNFQVLNIPENHPARDLQDTFYVDQKADEVKMLLRTHTSNSQVRIMKQFNSPLRFMDIGRCFRYENLDARHEHTFDQFEIVYIDKGVSMTNLQYLSEYFLKNVFGKDIKVRLRPKYYPFVEPGQGLMVNVYSVREKAVKFVVI